MPTNTTVTNYQVHLRDGGERVGVNRVYMRYNAEIEAYEFYTENGELDSTFPVDTVKYIQRKFFSSEKT